MKKLPKRCKFHAMCGHDATHQAYHIFLKRDVAVCDTCPDTNEYLEPIACEGDEVEILDETGKTRDGAWQGIIAQISRGKIDVLTRDGREQVARERLRVVGKRA